MLQVYNTLTRQKELFKPIHQDVVGMYVCGPTVYGDAHLGHARVAIVFDVLYRYLQAIGYKVRYVRNITDVGHLENDADAGDDKIAKKARLEHLEPMEVAQYYANNYHHDIQLLNVLPPSIEPLASGHIIEQIACIQQIIDNGFAYVSDGNVYFDVEAYAKKYHYGKLSGRNLEDIKTETRALEGQETKRHSYDFALWKKASPEHIMHWPSPWSEGFPGWHIECSAMGKKYLGEEFDIHGGGMDLMFPHHEAEIAQSCAMLGHEAVHYWIHNNMITVAGKKMGKSYNNFITLQQFFTGQHPLLTRPIDPMTIRLFILMAHYRSTLDFTNDALLATRKGLEKLQETYQRLNSLTPSDSSTPTTHDEVAKLYATCMETIEDDLNTPILLAHIFDSAKVINACADGKVTLTKGDIVELQRVWQTFVIDILGLQLTTQQSSDADIKAYEGAVDLLLQMRSDAKSRKDWATSDFIRDKLNQLGFQLQDNSEKTKWILVFQK